VAHGENRRTIIFNIEDAARPFKIGGREFFFGVFIEAKRLEFCRHGKLSPWGASMGAHFHGWLPCLVIEVALNPVGLRFSCATP